MHRDDFFFMRYIEQLTRGVARILGLKRENKLQEAGQQADDLLKELLGINAKKRLTRFRIRNSRSL